MRQYLVPPYLLMVLLMADSATASASPNREDVMPGVFTQEAIVDRALDALEDHFLMWEGPHVDLRPSTVDHATRGISHVRFQQTIGDVPVFEGEAIVHLRQDGTVFHITDNLFRGLEVSEQPRLSLSEAIDTAILEEARNDEYTSEPVAELLLVMGEEGPVLAWRVSLFIDDDPVWPSLPVYFVDASSGEILFRYDNLQTANQTGVGTTLYSGTVPVEAWKGSTYYLQDIDYRRHGTFDGSGESNQTSSTCKSLTDSDNKWHSTYQMPAVDVHMGTQQALDYFQWVLGRNGLDGKGGPTYCKGANGSTPLITSRVHFGTKYNNAFWNGKFMTYGDGDGTNFSPLVSLDIVGHELAHGVTQNSAALTYAYESGALNESMSDVFGTLIEFYTFGSRGDWKMGEDAYTPTKAGDALRHLDNPHLASNKGYTSDDDPDHYTERYTGPGDNGGVHINSGIANKAFFLVAKGGSHHLNSGQNLVGLGTGKAGAIWYLALTRYMTSCTNFSGAREATLRAAQELFQSTSTEYKTVAAAWDMVGVPSSTSVCTTVAAPSSPIQTLR